MPVILFMGQTYYLRGGVNDHIGTYESAELAQQFVSECCAAQDKYNGYPSSKDIWAQIVSIDGGQLQLISTYRDGVWDYAPALPSRETRRTDEASSDDYLFPEHAQSRWESQQDFEAKQKAEETRRRQVDYLYEAHSAARRQGDAVDMDRLREELKALGEDV